MTLFRRHFVARVFIISFVGVHIPLLALAVLQLTRAQSADWAVIVVLLLATVVGTVITFYNLHRELQPILHIADSLKRFADTGEVRKVHVASNDEIARLGTAVDWSIDRIRGLLDEHNRASRKDPLTGLYNRRGMGDLVTKARGGSLALIDLDHFKAINDGHGHAKGDEVLVAVARVLQSAMRPTDGVARWGGEEFLIYLDNTDAQDAVWVIDSLRDAVAADITVAGSAVTFSAGIAPLEGDLESTLRLCDRGLYEAKWAGRNRVAITNDARAGTLETYGPPRLSSAS
jgi:diguanylate cyclase (GGDEF)-like protein